MRLLIAGAGTIGYHLAASLASEELDVVVIDPDEQRLTNLINTVDCQTVAGNAMSPSQLEEIGIERFDLIVAVTNRDAINMIICRLAAHYGVPHKLARLRDPELSDPSCPVPLAHFGVDQVISPEGITVHHIESLIRCPGAREAMDFENGKIALRAFVVTEESSIAGLNLIELRQQLAGEYLVGGIRRGNRTVIPDGSTTLRVGDTVYIVANPNDLSRLATTFDPSAKPAYKVIISGADITGVLLARRLATSGIKVSLIERDERTAQKAAQELDPIGVEVLHGDPLNIELLLRCHPEAADFFVALTGEDELNLMSALLFRKYSTGRPIVMTQQPHHIDILESVDLDVIVNPRLLAVSSILRHIRSGMVLSVAKLGTEDAEVIELRASANCRMSKRPLREMKLPKGILVLGAMRKGELHLASGNFHVQAGDHVLLFVASNLAHKVESLFR